MNDQDLLKKEDKDT